MILFLYGADTFRSRQQLTRMIEKFKQDRDPQGLNVAVLDAEKEKEATLLEQVFASPFLAEKRMVVIERLLATKQTAVQKELLKRIEEQVIPSTTVLVFWEEGEKFSGKEAKALSERLFQEKYAQQYESLTGAKLVAWIATEVEARGGKITREAALYLANAVGPDMWYVDNVIEQCIAYASASEPHPSPPLRGEGAFTALDVKEINLSVVQLFVDEKVDDNIFNLVDGILARQSKKVFAMMQEQYRQGNDPGYIFAMIVRQVRILLELKDLIEREHGLTNDILAKRLGLHPFVVKKSLSVIGNYSFDDLKKMHAALSAIDMQTKTGQGDQSLLLDLFVGRLTAL